MRPAIAIVLGLALTGCTLFGKEEKRPCPSAVVLKDASTVVLYRTGGGRDLTDVEFQGRIARIAISCLYDNNKLTSYLKLDIVAERGPASNTGEANLPYFVAVVRKPRKILAKKVFDSIIPFKDGRRRVVVREEIAETLRLEDFQSGADIEILAGFQLTEEQLDFNRRRTGIRR